MRMRRQSWGVDTVAGEHYSHYSGSRSVEHGLDNSQSDLLSETLVHYNTSVVLKVY